MSTFVVNPHGRLQEWIAHQKGYFNSAGLSDYELSAHKLLTRDTPKKQYADALVPETKDGAYQTYEQGRDASVSCACHWTVLYKSHVRRHPALDQATRYLRGRCCTR